MRLEAGRPAPRAWTIMLADVVGLMLAFFVLSFSMREFVPVEPRPTPTHPDAIAALELPSPDQLRALEQERASAPSFAYLAAVIGAHGPGLPDAAIWHDDTRLVVRLPGRVEAGDHPADATSRELVLAFAFLARRFDLDLALEVPRLPGDTIEEGLVRAAAIRGWLAETAALGPIETTLAPVATGEEAVDRRQPWIAALNARSAQVPATAASRP